MALKYSGWTCVILSYGGEGFGDAIFLHSRKIQGMVENTTKLLKLILAEVYFLCVFDSFILK